MKTFGEAVQDPSTKIGRAAVQNQSEFEIRKAKALAIVASEGCTLKALLVAMVAALAFAGSAMATPVARITATNPAASLQYVEQAMNHVPDVTASHCRVYGGNAKTGWRHLGCVGTITAKVSRDGSSMQATVRFKMVITFVSCSSEKVSMVVAAMPELNQTGTQSWSPGKHFGCKAS